MDAANALVCHYAVATLLPAVLARGHAPLLFRSARPLLLSADRAQGMGAAQSGPAPSDEAACAPQRSSSAQRIARHPHR